MPRELLHKPLAKQRLDGFIALLTLDALRVGARLKGKGVAKVSMLLWLSVEGPTSPLIKISDDTEVE